MLGRKRNILVLFAVAENYLTAEYFVEDNEAFDRVRAIDNGERGETSLHPMRRQSEASTAIAHISPSLGIAWNCLCMFRVSVQFNLQIKAQMALTPNPPEDSVKISFGVYKPTDGHDIDDAVAHLRALISSAERAANLKATILKSVNGSWVAVFCVSSVSQNRTEDDEVIRVVDWGSFQMITEEQKGDYSTARLSVGDIVSVRRIYTDFKNQEMISYSCLAVLKSYFAQTEGLNSYAFYKSKDEKLILGLGIWDSADFASALLDSRKGSPGEAYWKDLGANNLKYEICQVVYMTKHKSPPTEALPQRLLSTDEHTRKD